MTMLVNPYRYSSGGGGGGSVVLHDSTSASGGSAKSGSVAYPSGIASGDLLTLIVMRDSQNTNVATPAGWTLVYAPPNVPGGSGQNGVHLYSRVADGSESGSLSVSWDTASGAFCGFVLAMLRTSGASVPNVDEVRSGTGPTSLTNGSLNAAAGSLMIHAGHLAGGGGTLAFSDDAVQFAGNATLWIAGSFEAAGGETGTQTITFGDDIRKAAILYEIAA